MGSRSNNVKVDEYKALQKLFEYKNNEMNQYKYDQNEITVEEMKNENNYKNIFVSAERAFEIEENYKHDIEKLNNQNEKLQEERKNFDFLNSLKKANQEMLVSDIALQEHYIEEIKKLNKIYCPNINTYDLIISISSLQDLKEDKGWKINYPHQEDSKVKYERYKIDWTTVVGVIGIFNKGKSFILQKLSKQPIPQGYSVSTEGLSIKYPVDENNPLTILDTAGFETPIKTIIKKENSSEIKKNNEKTDIDINININKTNHEDDDKHDEKINGLLKDRVHTEIFLQKFIIKYSNILLIVVGILTFSDQKLINRLKVLADKKKLVVIHNLLTYTNVEEVENYIENTLHQTFDVKKLVIIEDKHEEKNCKNDDKINKIKKNEDNVENNDKPNHYYQEKLNNESEITHIIIAKENTKAGDKYNSSSFYFLDNLIKAFSNRQVFDPVESLKNHLFELSKEIFEKDFQEKIKNSDNIGIENDKIFIKGAVNIGLTKCYIDELGISNFQSSGFLPDHSITKTINNQLLVKLDIPDLKSLEIMEIETRGQNNYELTIKGKKKEDIESESSTNSLLNNRKKGEFTLILKISKESLNFANLNPDDRKYENGVVYIFYDLVKKTDTKNNVLEFD